RADRAAGAGVATPFATPLRWPAVLLPLRCGRTAPGRRPERLVEPLDHLLFDSRQQMAVGVHGRLDLGVTGAGLDRLHGRVLGDQLADVAVAEAVNVEAGQTGLAG